MVHVVRLSVRLTVSISVCLSVRPALAKFCPINYLKPFMLRNTITCGLVKSPIDDIY